jgi:hypothetical protein
MDDPSREPVAKSCPKRSSGRGGFVALVFLLVILQVVGVMNLGIIGDWLRYGLSDLWSIVRAYLGIAYFLLAWFFWVAFTRMDLEATYSLNRVPSYGEIAAMPLHFLFTMAFWPSVVIYALIKERDQASNRQEES